MNPPEIDRRQHLVHYRFRLNDGRVLDFEVDRSRVFDSKQDHKPHAAWTRLDFHQCQNCPLRVDEFKHCPAAVDLEPVTARFSDIFSHERVEMEVRTPERSYVHECDAQTGLRALLGLIMSTSACPILSQMKVLASMHLPFASMQELTFRFCGAYLIRQFLESKNGRTPDWELSGLLDYFQQLQTLNECFKERLESAVTKDSNLNAMGTLFNVALGMQMSVEENLEEFRQYF